MSVRRPSDGASDSEIFVLTVPWHAAEEVVHNLALPPGRIVVDATNLNPERDGAGLDPGPGGTTSRLRDRFGELRWVKAFNMLWSGWMRPKAPQQVVFVAADDAAAKRLVAGLIRDTGFVPFDTGSLADAEQRQLQSTPAWTQRLDAIATADLLPGPPAPSP